MKVYDPRIQGGYRERLSYVIDAFNAASRGGISLSTVTKNGNFDYKAFWSRVSGLVNRRDTTSVAAATATKSAQAEHVSVKLNRRIGPHETTRDALLKAGFTNFGDDGAAFALGEWVAEATAQERVDTAILALRAALLGQTELVHSIWHASVPVYMSNSALINGLKKVGDASAQIICLVMHSHAWFKLVEGQVVTDKVSGIADVVMFGGSPATMNRPVLVMDNPNLIVDPGSDLDKYYTLGLTANAAEVEDTEQEYITSDIITGLEQIVHRLQGEYAYNLGVKGQTWDVGNGGANPNNAAIGTSTNWDKVVSSHKSLGGIIIEHN